MVVVDCIFDRGQTSYKVNLLDMQAKYDDVMPQGAALSYPIVGRKTRSR
jgi:hypothetical protein